MGKGWLLGRVADIGIYVHWSFLILPVYVALASFNAGASLAAVGLTLILLVAVFGCVVLHELGHALSARHYGIRTRSITLYPIGGVAALERMPRHPIQELVIALAGPAVNVVIAIGLYLLLSVVTGVWSPSSAWLIGGGILSNLLLANVILVVFNLLPAFPMDGGRVLRALLATRLSYRQATEIAAVVGQVLAIGLGIAGFFVGWTLILVAGFVFLAAAAERAQVRWQDHQAAVQRMQGNATFHPGGQTVVTTPIRTVVTPAPNQTPRSAVIDMLAVDPPQHPADNSAEGITWKDDVSSQQTRSAGGNGSQAMWGWRVDIVDAADGRQIIVTPSDSPT